MKSSDNIFANLPNLTTGEDFTTLLRHQNVVIERIVSSEQPDATIYNQGQAEWVIIIEGQAILKINDEQIQLKTGDYLFIPANTPHQVITTSSGCVWLAIHIYQHSE